MSLYFTLNKRSLALILSAVLVLTFISFKFFVSANEIKNGDTNQKRITFAKKLNLEISNEPIASKEVNIPLEFGDVYEKYNDIQKKAGYDLREYAGCKATLYTYEIKNKNDMNLNILVYKGRIIGGDISSVRLDGEMLPLKKT